DRNVARNRLKSFGLVRPGANQNIGPQRHEFSRQPREARKITVACPQLDLHILAFAPAERIQIVWFPARLVLVGIGAKRFALWGGATRVCRWNRSRSKAEDSNP